MSEWVNISPSNDIFLIESDQIGKNVITCIESLRDSQTGWISTDYGGSWSSFSVDRPQAVGVSRNGKVFVLGSWLGSYYKIFLSFDYGATWIESYSSENADAEDGFLSGLPTGITVDETGEIIAIFNEHIAYITITTDGGETWTRKPTNLTDPEPWGQYGSLDLSFDNSSLLLAHYYAGVFISDNLGDSWSEVTPPAPTYDGWFWSKAEFIGTSNEHMIASNDRVGTWAILPSYERTWVRVDNTPYGDTSFCSASLDGTTLAWVGYSGDLALIEYSLDGGNTTEIYNTSNGFYGYKCVAANNGVIYLIYDASPSYDYFLARHKGGGLIKAILGVPYSTGVFSVLGIEKLNIKKIAGQPDNSIYLESEEEE